MPGFGTGLAEGLLSGWSQAEEKRDAIKRQERQQDLDRYIRIATAQDLPDDTRAWALGQVQSTVQGKKPGAKGAGGPLSPVLQQLQKLIGMAHGGQQAGQQQPAGATPPFLPPGTQAAPQQPQVPPPAQIPQAPPLSGAGPQSGRPSLAGSGNAQTEPGAPSPAQPEARQQRTIDVQLDNLQRQLSQTTNPITRKNIQAQIDSLNDTKIKQEFAMEAEAGRERIAQIRADGAREVARLNDEFKEKLAKAAQEGKAELARVQAELRAKQKEIDDRNKREEDAIKAQNQKDLKKTVPGKAAGTGGGRSASTTGKFAAIETRHQNAYTKLGEEVKRMQDAAMKLPSTQRANALKAAEDFRKAQSAQIENAYKAEIRAMGGSTESAAAPAGGAKDPLGILAQ